MKKFRVAEVFGPTIQGEGRHVGVPCHFIRFGGCDYACLWCDSFHAVLPEYVKMLPRLTIDEIIEQVVALADTAEWIVYSGGNPVLFDLADLTRDLQEGGYRVMIETQGTVYKPWLQDVDEVCVSPKGPSAKIGTHEQSLARLEAFIACEGMLDHQSLYFKIPVFGEEDYAFASDVHTRYPQIEMFLSVGNSMPPRAGSEDTPRPVLRATVLRDTEELVNRVLSDAAMSDVRVFPQQHVLIWGNTRAK